ncbi:MAG: hypothetical protein HWE10_09485 [Gammaproteobacteria bacterium]|nr:hypothetical protein [Gammaproteobacteria bacterium]
MSEESPTFGQWLITGTWFVFTLICFVYLTFDRLIAFDPQDKLTNISPDVFQQKLVDINKDLLGIEPKKGIILHFQQNDCACNVSSEAHVNALKELAQMHTVEFRNIDPTLIPDIVPSTPSVAILDDNGQLVYFGPYGEGLDCSQTDGFALTVFNNYLKGFSASLLISDAEGCYCNI